jgi:hypothetical protein
LPSPLNAPTFWHPAEHLNSALFLALVIQPFTEPNPARSGCTLPSIKSNFRIMMIFYFNYSNWYRAGIWKLRQKIVRSFELLYRRAYLLSPWKCGRYCYSLLGKGEEFLMI